MRDEERDGLDVQQRKNAPTGRILAPNSPRNEPQTPFLAVNRPKNTPKDTARTPDAP